MRSAVAEWLQPETGAGKIEITGAKLLSGGAIQENWLLDLTIQGGRLDGLPPGWMKATAGWKNSGCSPPGSMPV